MPVLINGTTSTYDEFNAVSGKNNNFTQNTVLNNDPCNLETLYNKIFIEFSQIYDNIMNNKFDDELLRRENLQELSSRIYRLRIRNSIYYNSLLTLLQNYITIINKQIDTYKTNQELNIKIDKLTEENSILNDLEKLQEYITSLLNSFNIFNEQNITLQTSVQIDKKYSIYVELYGYPKDGIFDYTKLQDIVDQYNLN